MLVKNVKKVEVRDWDDLVTKTYTRIYNFQQQEGCKSRGIFQISIPCQEEYDDDMNETIPEVVNGDVMGVKFKNWLGRDPKEPIVDQKYDHDLDLFWRRNFYPDIYTVANDLYAKGLLEAGEYIINIDW